ncbi:MAG TPA: hypothetical protein VD886_01700 [Herpetosiphonaceae bacterium]|nr:hypothetical protein [Herpetosiphonaceae bacterium]
MTDAIFDTLVSESLRIATASAGANLAGFGMDLAYALEQKAGLSRISVIKTGDRRYMLRATCSAQASTDAAGALAHVWEQDLRYAAFAAHRIRRDGPATELAFVTRSGDDADSLCVTGLIRVIQASDEA